MKKKFKRSGIYYVYILESSDGSHFKGKEKLIQIYERSRETSQ